MSEDKNSDIQQELENRFLTYALSTIVSRSLPDVRDGLKPIHRRILYAMDSIGVSETSKHVKSAKIIGEVLGKYHPHGDASTYESMVRMAQDFSMRYPLVDGKGNFGSVDGDSPAAYRYTEGRLTPITAYLLADLKKDTVDFRQNYDNTLKEPVVLPSVIPNLLVNGSSGIAVGMACSFPSHNLREVIAALIALTHDNTLTTTQLMKHIKGPDFPTGGILLTPKAELREAYEKGSGNVKTRGEWSLEDLPRGKQQIILTSIPYGVNKAKLIEKIAEIIIAKKLPSLLDVRDESDEKIRVVLEMKIGADAEKVMSYLIRHTDFETGFQLNFTCLKPNGEPDRLSLPQICNYFLEFRKEVITRKLRYELALLERRLHILQGFAAIFGDLDKALKLIRSSKSRQEAHDRLKKAFNLDDEQAKAILEIPLYRLVSMEIGKIIEETNEKLKEKKRISEILSSPAKILQEIRQELEEIDKKFGDKRLTKIKSIESLETVEYRAEDFIEHEDVTLVISRNGWLRKLKTLSDPTSLKFKENDQLLGLTQTNTRDLVAFFTSLGTVYIHKVYNLPYTRSGFGEPIQSLFKFSDGEKVILVMPLPAEDSNAEQNEAESGTKKQKALPFSGEDKTGGTAELMVAGNTGFGFRFPKANLTETTRSGRRFMSIKGEERIIGISPVVGSHVFLAASNGKGLLIPIDQVPQLSGSGKGVKLIKLHDSQLAGFKVITPKDKATLIFDDGSETTIAMNKVPEYNRGAQGVIISKRKKIVNIV